MRWLLLKDLQILKRSPLLVSVLTTMGREWSPGPAASETLALADKLADRVQAELNTRNALTAPHQPERGATLRQQLTEAMQATNDAAAEIPDESLRDLIEGSLEQWRQRGYLAVAKADPPVALPSNP